MSWINTRPTTAADEKCFPAPLLAAFILRQVQGGAELDGTDGWKDCHNSNLGSRR